MSYKKSNTQACGFTLMEVAVVLVIIGLLIAGVLKGQELITNAKITKTIGQLQTYKAGVKAFQSMYRELPGDMRNPATRLSNCTASPCDVSGDGNKQICGPWCNTIDSYSSMSVVTDTSENRNFWLHMKVAGFINDVTDEPVSGYIEFGKQLPASALGDGGFTIGFYQMIENAGGISYSLNRHYYTLTSIPAASFRNGPTILAKNAAQIDLKIDDGKPLSGSVISPSADECVDSGKYNEAANKNISAGCTMHFKADF